MTLISGDVLVIDDDASDRDLLCAYLAHKAFAVITAESSAHALTCVEKHACDVVLLARHLSDASGTAILRALRAAYTAAELPIIMMETAGDNTAEVLDLGASDWVTKPLDYRLVLARIGTQVARKRAEALWRESEARYALAVRAANDGIWDWELTTNAFSASPRWKCLLGYEEHESCPSLDVWFDRIAPEDREQVRNALTAHLGGETPYFECEHRMLDRDDTYRWMYSRGLASFNASGEPTRMAGSLTDITAWKVADRVTGLPNSVVLVDRISRAIEHGKRWPDKTFALLLVDIDRFSMINDSLGYAAGDHLLRIVARRLEACLRAKDLVTPYGQSQSIARMPGDKFAVFIEDITHASDAIRIATRIQNVLKVPFVLEARNIYLTTSIGITLSTTGYHGPENVVRDAEIALHRAKAHGKARYEIFDTAMHRQAMARLHVETELHDAIEREEFRAFYQPIVSLTSGHICGFEALVRWQHPQRGLLPPGAFIPVAEETGLIIPIGVWILREACRQIQHWQTQFPLASHLYLSVNLCGKELLEPHLVHQIASILGETGLTADCLTLEITESILMENAGAAANTLARLRDLGPRIAIDDFGTGYCSLNYLNSFPLDILKIDRSFVRKMAEGFKNIEIVRAIIALAHVLDLEVVAEGLETEEDVDQLRDLGCEYGQGYVFSRPLDAAAAEALLRQPQKALMRHVHTRVSH